MLKNVKRTKNNDLILNDKGLSVLNILCILSIWIALFFFIPVVKVDFGAGYLGESLKRSFSLFSFAFISGDDFVFGGLKALRGAILLGFFYPIANIVLWVLNKNFTGKKSYIIVHTIYLINVSFGFIHFTSMNGISSLKADFFKGTFFVWILLLILLANLVLSVYGILTTGRLEIDENAKAFDMNANYAKDMLNKAGNVATNVASNVSAAASKAKENKAADSKSASSNKIVCDSCGNECPETAGFCTKCGNNLENAKKAKEETYSHVDEAAKLAREMASNDINTEEVAASETIEKVEETVMENDKDDTGSKGVSLSK
jgi:hypothetical protein